MSEGGSECVGSVGGWGFVVCEMLWSRVCHSGFTRTSNKIYDILYVKRVLLSVFALCVCLCLCLSVVYNYVCGREYVCV